MRLKLLITITTLMSLLSCKRSGESPCIKMERVGVSDRFYYHLVFNTEKKLCDQQQGDPMDTLGYRIFVLSNETLNKLKEHILKESITSSQLSDEDYEALGCMFTLKNNNDSFQEYYILNTDSVSYYSFFEDLNSIIEKEQGSQEMIRLIKSLGVE